MKSVLYTFSFLFLLTSCASFSDKMIKKDKAELSENDLSRLEGTYNMFADFKYYEKGNIEEVDSEDIKKYSDLSSFIKDSETKSQRKEDVSENYSMEIKLINPNKLKFITRKNNVKIDSVELGGTLKKGLFYLDNKYVKRNGVPYVAGGYTNHKTRIGLSQNNNLILNYAYDNTGSFLFFMWAGNTYNYAYQYKRILSN